jgi:hypothetical protein
VDNYRKVETVASALRREAQALRAKALATDSDRQAARILESAAERVSNLDPPGWFERNRWRTALTELTEAFAKQAGNTAANNSEAYNSARAILWETALPEDAKPIKERIPFDIISAFNASKYAPHKNELASIMLRYALARCRDSMELCERIEGANSMESQAWQSLKSLVNQALGTTQECFEPVETLINAARNVISEEPDTRSLPGEEIIAIRKAILEQLKRAVLIYNATPGAVNAALLPWKSGGAYEKPAETPKEVEKTVQEVAHTPDKEALVTLTEEQAGVFLDWSFLFDLDEMGASYPDKHIPPTIQEELDYGLRNAARELRRVVGKLLGLPPSPGEENF